jgi:hypothetical protein
MVDDLAAPVFAAMLKPTLPLPVTDAAPEALIQLALLLNVQAQPAVVATLAVPDEAVAANWVPLSVTVNVQGWASVTVNEKVGVYTYSPTPAARVYWPGGPVMMTSHVARPAASVRTVPPGTLHAAAGVAAGSSAFTIRMDTLGTGPLCPALWAFTWTETAAGKTEPERPLRLRFSTSGLISCTRGGDENCWPNVVVIIKFTLPTGDEAVTVLGMNELPGWMLVLRNVASARPLASVSLVWFKRVPAPWVTVQSMAVPTAGLPAASFTCTTRGTLRNCSRTTWPFPAKMEIPWANDAGTAARNSNAKIAIFIGFTADLLEL